MNPSIQVSTSIWCERSFSWIPSSRLSGTHRQQSITTHQDSESFSSFISLTLDVWWEQSFLNTFSRNPEWCHNLATKGTSIFFTTWSQVGQYFEVLRIYLTFFLVVVIVENGLMGFFKRLLDKKLFYVELFRVFSPFAMKCHIFYTRKVNEWSKGKEFYRLKYGRKGLFQFN